MPTNPAPITHPTPCAKVPVGTDTMGRPVRHLPVACYVAARVELQPDGCWLWTGSKNPVTGYGVVNNAPLHFRSAHRVTYELLNGPVPEGLQLDHLCRVRLCVNPGHLEAVTSQINNRRAFTARGYTVGVCGRGHQRRENGHCGTCDREYAVRMREKINAQSRARRAALRAAGFTSRGRPIRGGDGA